MLFWGVGLNTYFKLVWASFELLTLLWFKRVCICIYHNFTMSKAKQSCSVKLCDGGCDQIASIFYAFAIVGIPISRSTPIFFVVLLTLQKDSQWSFQLMLHEDLDATPYLQSLFTLQIFLQQKNANTKKNNMYVSHKSTGMNLGLKVFETNIVRTDGLGL